MPEKQHYATSVNREASMATIKDIRENEQAVQAFTQIPSAGQAGGPEKKGLCAHDLFYLYTVEVIRQRTEFTR